MINPRSKRDPRILLSVLLMFCSLACSTPAKSQELMVSAAVSLKGTFEEYGRLFRERTGLVVRFNFAASGLLQKQIESGAPVDVFASAGQQQMDELNRRGLLLPGARRDFARNVLVLVAARDSRSGIRSIADIADKRLERLAIGNPKTVPAGLYSQQALRKLQLWDKLESRLIPAEDVRQVLDYVVRGEVDAGLVYATDIPVAGGKVVYVEPVPDRLHDPILYPIAAIKDSRQPDAAKRFIELVLSPPGQAILKKHGFLPVH